MESFRYVPEDIRFIVEITSSWVIAMLIVLSKKILSFSLPTITHEIHGIFATRIGKTGQTEGIFVFENAKVLFNKFDKNQVAWPDMDFPYSKIQSFGYAGSNESVYITTPKGKYNFVTTTERAQHILENLSNHTGYYATK